MRRYPGHRPASYRKYLCRRQLQARRRISLHRHHRQQESVGLRIQQVHHTMDREIRLCPGDYAEHVLDRAVVLLRHRLLLLREALPKVDFQVEHLEALNGELWRCNTSKFFPISPESAMNQNAIMI